MAEPVKCVCGRRGRVLQFDTLLRDGYAVVCSRFQPCWYGPILKTRRHAVNAWNRVMTAGKTEEPAP